MESELGHACPREPPGPGQRQKLLRFLTQSLAQRGSLCDVRRVTGGRAGGRAGAGAGRRQPAGRSVIPTDKRGSLSPRHKAAGRALGLGRLRGSARGPGRRWRAEVAAASSAPASSAARGLLSTGASRAARSPVPCRQVPRGEPLGLQPHAGRCRRRLSLRRAPSARPGAPHSPPRRPGALSSRRRRAVHAPQLY